MYLRSVWRCRTQQSLLWSFGCSTLWVIFCFSKKMIHIFYAIEIQIYILEIRFLQLVQHSFELSLLLINILRLCVVSNCSFTWLEVRFSLKINSNHWKFDWFYSVLASIITLRFVATWCNYGWAWSRSISNLRWTRMAWRWSFASQSITNQTSCVCNIVHLLKLYFRKWFISLVNKQQRHIEALFFITLTLIKIFALCINIVSVSIFITLQLCVLWWARTFGRTIRSFMPW